MKSVIMLFRNSRHSICCLADLREISLEKAIFLISLCHQCHCAEVLLTRSLGSLLHSFSSNFPVHFVLLIPLISKQLRTEKIMSPVQDLTLSFWGETFPPMMQRSLGVAFRHSQLCHLKSQSVKKDVLRHVCSWASAEPSFLPVLQKRIGWPLKRSRLFQDVICFVIRQIFRVDELQLTCLHLSVNRKGNLGSNVDCYISRTRWGQL